MSIVVAEQAPVVEFEHTIGELSDLELKQLDDVLATNPLAFVLRTQIDTYDDFLDLSRLVADRAGGGEVDNESPAIIGREKSSLHIDGTRVPTYWQGHHTRLGSAAASAFQITTYQFFGDDAEELRRYEETAPVLRGNPRDYSRFMSTIRRQLGHLPTARTAVRGICPVGGSLFFRNGFDVLTLTGEDEVPFHEFWSVDSTGEQANRERHLFLTRIV